MLLTWVGNFFRTMKISRLIGAVVVIFLIMVSVSYYHLTHSEQNNVRQRHSSSDAVRKMLSVLDPDDDKINGIELKRRINELLRIKESVQKELRDVEQKRSSDLKQDSELVRIIDEHKMEATRAKTELDMLRLKIEQARFAQKELAERNTPELRPPLRLMALPKDNFIAENIATECGFERCFDLARCPLSSGYPIYFYNNIFGWTSTKDGYGYSIKNPDEACLFVGAFDERSLYDFLFWKGDGRNHLLIDTNIGSFQNESAQINYKAISKKFGKAMIASTQYFDEIKPRLHFDIIVPPVKYFDLSPDLWSRLGLLVPIRRKYLMSYQEPLLTESKVMRSIIEEPLNLINDDKTSDKVVVDFHCKASNSNTGLCATFTKRSDLLKKSIFTLILSSSKLSDISFRLTEALESSTIPVIICMSNCDNFKDYLPFAEVIDWSKATIFLPVARITEIHFLLRSFVDSDIFALKRQGRLLWQNYLGSGPAVMSTILNLVRTRIGMYLFVQ